MTDTHQWDGTTERLLAYSEKARYDALSGGTIHQTKLRLIDTFASAIGAFDEPLSVMARKVASRTRGEVEATVWGTSTRTTPEAAAFANGVMVRLLDISDTYLGQSRGHPSDMTSGLIALAEATRADGRALINAVVLAYDIYCSFAKSADINSKGWDQPIYSGLGCVVGAAKLLGFDRAQTANAIALQVAPNMALAQSRRGHLSAWKGCAGANASRNAVFAAMLAQDGFTGPTAVFEGDGGLFQAIGKFDWILPEGEHMIDETHIKDLPVCYHGQSPVQAAVEMRARIDPRNIESIEVDTYRAGVTMMAGDPSKWAPRTRETADHSLPYCISVALIDGKVKNASFSEERLRDPAIANLMRKVKVREDASLTARYPESPGGRVTVRMASGEAHTGEVSYPRGHHKSPMSDADIERKFRELAGPRLGTQKCNVLLDAVRRLERSGDVALDLVKPLSE